jgi:hypothetical protein
MASGEDKKLKKDVKIDVPCAKANLKPLKLK